MHSRVLACDSAAYFAGQRTAHFDAEFTVHFGAESTVHFDAEFTAHFDAESAAHFDAEFTAQLATERGVHITRIFHMTGATVGKVAIVSEDGLLLNQRVGLLRAKPNALQSFVFCLLRSSEFYDYCQRTAGGGAQGNISPRDILEYQMPLPHLDVQSAIVAEIEAEQALVAANCELIIRMEKKIEGVLKRVWGEE